MKHTTLKVSIWLAAAWLAVAPAAHAQLFGDDQARQAILDLRQRFDQAVIAQNKLVDENAQMRRSMLDLQQQIETLRTDLAQSRGQQEQLTRDIAELRQQLTDQKALEERLQKLEGSGGGDNAGATAEENAVTGDERQEYDAALAVFRGGNYKAAQSSFNRFIKRYPSSALAPAALFWLGNAQYATREYKSAIANFRSLLAAAPNHQKAPEALLSIANCQLELKDTNAARSTLQSLIKNFPKSEAAQAGRERLAGLGG